MGEIVRNLVMFIWAFSVIESDVQAQLLGTYTVEREAPVDSSVWVYGSANGGNGHRNSILLEQNNEENPLGNPIEMYDNIAPQIQSEKAVSEQSALSIPKSVIQENLPQNPKISAQESPQVVNQQIQNTLYESGGRIYDIQSYPATDINEIEKPNLNPTITTYPAY